MDPESLDLEAGAQGLAVLCFIPVVIFALWAEYFANPLNEEEAGEERDPLEKVRLASLCVVLFQLTLFLGSSEIRHAYPLATEIAFVGGILTQLWLQGKTERRVLPVVKKISKQSAKDPPSGSEKDSQINKIFFGTVLTWSIGAVLYVITLTIAIKSASWASTRFHASSELTASFLLFGAALGVIAGSGLNYALSPIFLKKMLPALPLEDPQLRKTLESYFSSVGLKPPIIWVIELETFEVITAVLTGFRIGWGPLRQSLFISRSILKNLSLSEIRAIVLNQVSHLLLSHSRNRFLFSFSLIIGTTLLSALSVLISQTFLPTEMALEMVGPVFALLAFFLSVRFLSQQYKKQELEADLYSIEKLGVRVDDFESALRKLELPFVPEPRQRSPESRHLSESQSRSFPQSNPLEITDTEKRIERVKAHLPQIFKETQDPPVSKAS